MIKLDGVKGILAGAVLTIGLAAAVGTVSAGDAAKEKKISYNNVKINVSGEHVEFKDEKGEKLNPLLIDGTTYIPLRGIAEQLGHAVAWDKSENIVYVENSDSGRIINLKSETVRNPELENSIKKVMELASDELKETRYYYNYVDVDGDGQNEVFVQLVGMYVSGTGGDTGLLFRQKDGLYEHIQTFTLVRNPVIVSNNRTNGWHDLIMEMSGGGAERVQVKLQFNGKKYPTVSDGVKVKDSEQVSGTALIHNDIAQDFELGKGLYLK